MVLVSGFAGIAFYGGMALLLVQALGWFGLLPALQDFIWHFTVNAPMHLGMPHSVAATMEHIYPWLLMVGGYCTGRLVNPRLPKEEL